jgi:hypothetical protein
MSTTFSPEDRLASLKLDRDRAMTALDRIKMQAAGPTIFDPAAIERFGRLMRETVATGETPFRKIYIRSAVERIEVDDEVIRIAGGKATLEEAVAGRAMAPGGVRSRAPKWRATQDKTANTYVIEIEL